MTDLAGSPRVASIAVVTGASSGIGAAVAVELARNGWRVACLSRRGTAPAVHADVATAANMTAITCDVAQPRSCDEAVRQVREQVGVPRALVNVAGRHVEQAAADVSQEELTQTWETNVGGPLRLAQLVHPDLARRSGAIVNVGSIFADLGVPGNLAYAASKAALASVTRSLSVEWARDEIAVVNLAPGYVETSVNAEFLRDPQNRRLINRRTALGRMVTAEEIATLVRMLVDGAAVALTGQTIYADGGQMVKI